MLDINAPLPFELDGVRFVFFTASQKVTESFDNLPAFSFEVASVSPGGEISWNLYVSARLGDIGQLLDLEPRTYPAELVSDFERNRVRDAAKELLKYVRKHYGGKVKVTLSEPALSDFLTEDDRYELLEQIKTKTDFTPEVLAELLIWVYYSASMAAHDDAAISVSTAKSSTNSGISNYIKIDLVGIGDWRFTARTGDKKEDIAGTAIRGTAIYDGTPVRISLHSRTFQSSIYLDQVLPFINAALIEDVVNRAYNEVCVGENQPFQTVLSDVVLDQPWNRA